MIKETRGKLGVTALGPNTVKITYAGSDPVRDVLLRAGYRGLLAVPLLREDRILPGLEELFAARPALEWLDDLADAVLAKTRSMLGLQPATLDYPVMGMSLAAIGRWLLDREPPTRSAISVLETPSAASSRIQARCASTAGN